MHQWTLARRAAQLVVIPALDGQLRPLGPILSTGVGGVLLLGNQVPIDLRAQVDDANRAAATQLFVMADEEGGGVQRLAGHVDALPWARQMAASLTPAQVQAAATRVGSQMRSLGVNMDLAPVLDVDGGDGPNARDADGQRSFSSDPAIVSTYGGAFLDGILAAGVTPVVKHFPGLGGATANTDLGPAETLPLPVLQGSGLAPFRDAIARHAPAVMVANASVPDLTPLPASISTPAIAGLLRGDLGFRGLVLTDSLSAGAVTDAGYDVTAAAVTAVESGADMVLFGSTLNAAATALLSPGAVASQAGSIVSALVAAARSGRLPVDRLDQAVSDVLTAKHLAICSS